jgi:peptidoglycan hydrolase-like protein with peptidoglycan-binding domain
MTPTAPGPEARPPRRRVMRATRSIAMVLVLAGVAGTAAFVLERHEAAANTPASNTFKTAEVTAGNLTTSEKIDGTFELASSLTVLHRIEGQTSSATSTPSSSPNSSTKAATPKAAGASFRTVTPAPAQLATMHIRPSAVPPPCSGPEGQADATTTSTTEVATTTSIAPSADCPTPGADSTPTPTTMPAPAPPTDLEPTSTTSSATSTTDTTLAAGGTRTGGFGGRSSSTSTGAASGASGAGSSASTARVTQIVTSVIADGSTVGLGDVLYSVESKPVVVLSGSLPAWRSLSTASDDGPDIQELESSLVALGYDPSHTVTVDNVFDSHTRAMVKRWQSGLGVEATGTVTLGSVVFLPLAGGAAATTVTDVEAKVGDAVDDGSSIVTLTAPTQRVVIDVPDGDETFIVPGLSVAVGSDGATGTVALLRSVERDGGVVVQATIVPDAPVSGLDNGASLKVTVTTNALEGVLVAPAEALVSHLDGTYAVQVRAVDGTVTWHTVDLLGVSGNKVAIRGDGIASGTVVLVPA